MASYIQNYFDLFVTCVDKVGPMLKIWGQTDRVNSLFIEQLLKNTSDQFEKESYPTNFTVGLLCCAKYKDGHYYRAQITNLRNLVSGAIEVKFIDYGNVEIISVENIRLLSNVPTGLSTIKPQAFDFILANTIHVNQNWDEKSLAFIHQEMAYIELKCMIVGAVNNFRFIKVMFHDTDLGEYLSQKGIAIQIPLSTQELMIHGSKPVAAQYQQYPVAAPVIAPRPTYVNLPTQQVQQLQSPVAPPQELCSYKTLPLEPNSEHMVYVSYVEDGPYLFSIQLQSLEDVLEKLMIDINQLPLLPLTETPVPGYPCMARCLEDDSLCRAVVINLVEDKCKTYHVDFGNTDILPFSNIFQIPFKYILPKVMSMRFTLAGLKNMNVTNEMKCAFKEYVTNRLLKLKVLKLEGSPVLQYCELYDAERSVVDILYDNSKEFKTVQVVKGGKHMVIVSYIEGCKKFFVQLKEFSDKLNQLMLTLANICETSFGLPDYQVGMPCVAFYSGDNQWYRALILAVNDNAITVKYVDYGNVETVARNCLKKIDPTYVKILPAQAVECCLYGYQNMSFNSEIEQVFESLTLECEFTMRIISKQSNDTLLVDLFDSLGNNVAALLIEKLAAQNLQQTGPLPANKVTRSVSYEQAIPSPTSEMNFTEDRSPRSPRNQEKLSWRNAKNDDTASKSWKGAGNDRQEKRAWNNTNDTRNDAKKNWRNVENSPPNNRNGADTWNGDSPTNKRSSQRNDRNERTFSRNNKDDNTKSFGDRKKSPQFESNRNNWNHSGSESEKSWSGSSKSGKNFAKKDFKQRKSDAPRSNFQKPKRELPVQDLAPFEQEFQYIEIVPGLLEKISISWFYDPENFYCQILSQQDEFRQMMGDIQTAYAGRPPVNETIPVNASVIAEFQDDTILYRAKIIENKYPKYKVQYVDFGNMSVVDSKKIWQVETKFMNLPMQAIKCGLFGLKAAANEWSASSEIDQIFNKENFDCMFETWMDDKYGIQLFDNDVSVKQHLIDSGLAVDALAACEMADEPVLLDILIGQNITIHISYVFGLNKFYIYLEKEKALKVHEFIQSHVNNTDVTSLQKYTEDLVTLGATCLVKGEDEKWYRGVIKNNSDLAALEIDHPDIGGFGTYALDQIFILPQEICVHWYQAFECSIHNLSDSANKLISDEDFKQNCQGKDFIIYVDEILDGRIIVTLYDCNGTKLDLIEPDEGAFPTIEPLCPMPVLRPNLSVWISHINNAKSLYLQYDSNVDTVATLLENLFEFYDTTTQVAAELTEGDLCCTKSEIDGNWYRSRIETVNSDSVKVIYIDYGNGEEISKNNLRTLDQSFYSIPELALQVSLNLQEISEQLTDKLTELTAEKNVTAAIFYGETGWFVELFDGATSINQTLIELNLAAIKQDETILAPVTETKLESYLTEESAQIIDETRAQITITHIDSPSEFYVQLVANENSITALQEDLQEKIAELPDLEGADIGVLCAAKYTVDEQWYRAEVLDADSEITTVRFVDFGNTDVINNNDGSIKTLPADLLAVDKYARKCSLNLMPLKGDEWPQEAAEIFEHTVDSETIFADIVYQDEKNKTYVELFINGENIAEKLSQLATPITRDIEDNIANNTGFISHMNSVSEFWIQLESSVPDLEMIADRLASTDSFPDLQDLSPGILCAANFPDDEMWYRARILSNTVAGIEVLFVDYGNSSTAMKLKVLPEDLVQMPALAQKCSLNKPTTVTIWSDRATEKFRNISEDGATVFGVKKLSAGETSTVELFVDGQNLVEQLLAYAATIESDEIRSISKVNTVKVHVTHVESPDHFWVQLNSDSDKIDEMTEYLSTADNFAKLSDWNMDTTCAALYGENGLWYRAKILEFVDQYEVLLIDYGNTMCTNDLRELPETIASIPPLASLCSLQMPEDVNDWSDLAATRFANAITNGYTECQIEFVNRDMPSTVQMFIDGRNIAEKILSDDEQHDVESSASTTLLPEQISLLAVNTKLPEPSLDALDELLEVEETLNEATEEIQTKELIENVPEVENETNTKFDEKSTEIVESDNVVDEEETKYDKLDEVLTEEIGKTNELVEAMSKIDDELLKVDEKNDEKSSEIAEKTNDDKPVKELEKTKEFVEATPKVDDEITKDDPSLKDAGKGDEDKPVKDVEETNELPKDISQANEVKTNTQETIELDEALIKDSKTEESADDDDKKQENLTNEEKLKDNRDLETVESSDTTDEDESILKMNESLLSLESVLNNTSSYVSLSTLHSDKIVSGYLSRGDSEHPPTDLINTTNSTNESFFDTDNNIYENQLPNSRPVTPHCDKIVPGSICRGDLEEVPVDDDLEFEIEQTQLDYGRFETPRSRSVTPFSEKIVPGSICRGQIPSILDFNDTEPIRPATPISDKIVPGCVSRGDLEEPPCDEENLKTIPDAVINEPKMEIYVRPKTPVDEKIVPGSICRGTDTLEESHIST